MKIATIAPVINTANINSFVSFSRFGSLKIKKNVNNNDNNNDNNNNNNNNNDDDDDYKKDINIVINNIINCKDFIQEIKYVLLEATEKMFYFFNKIIIFRLNKEKDNLRSARV